MTRRASEPPELRECRRLLGRLLNERYVSFHCEPLGTKGSRYELTGPSVRPASDGAHRYKAHRFLQLDGQIYWVAVVLEYSVTIDELCFSNASMVLFHGLAEGEKQALLRAEWQLIEGRSPHAQPHWHVYRATDLGWPSVEQSSQLRHMHLAMAARWHERGPGADAYYCVPSREEIGRWVHGCLEYVRGQLRFAGSRSG